MTFFRHFYCGGEHVFFFFLAQDWGVRFHDETTRCAKSTLAAAALPAAPPRPRTREPVQFDTCGFSWSISNHALLSGCDEAVREVSAWCSSSSGLHQQQAQGRRSRARHQPNWASTLLLYPIQAPNSFQRPAAVRGGSPGHSHLHCRPCRVRRSWSPSPISTSNFQSLSLQAT